MTQNMKNATGGEVAPSASTSGVRPTPNSLKEITMTKSNPTTVPKDEAFIKQDLAQSILRAGDLTKADLQKISSLKAEIDHARDMLKLAKRDLFIWQVKRRAAQILDEEAQA